MGADGHITIWRDDKVREAFPDCDRLFGCLPTHYADDLDGVLYHHCYHGDNLMADWSDASDWFVFGEWDAQTRRFADITPEEREALYKRLQEFCQWLEGNGTPWEVWT
ncbi:MAG TPA: hypothetical protein VLH12_08530 [Usitatibacter sp.]|nr:hypothetical protein [Usitatibacter sp.]